MFRHSPRLRIVVRAGVVAIGLLALAGFLDQRLATSRDARRFPAPGPLVDVGGGRRVHVRCIGDGTPTILFEPASFEQTCLFGGRAPSRQIPLLLLMGRTDQAVFYPLIVSIREAAIARYGVTGPQVVAQDATYTHSRWVSPRGCRDRNVRPRV